MTDIIKALLAEDIISQLMAQEESLMARAIDEKKFHSLRLLNQCRKYFGMKSERLMNPKDFKECV